MDRETQTTRRDAAPPPYEAQHFSANGDNAGRNGLSYGLHATVNAAVVNGVPDGRSNPGLGETGVTLPGTPAGAFGNGFETARDGIPLAFAEDLERTSGPMVTQSAPDPVRIRRRAA